ncbi:UNVERIFIED_CONTAM: hypothetical protein PYX00_009362 [Menopon gallinae]|uniref:Ribosomal protein 63, mitochondrial n=1 Tax=Menopon gallinae TaxID=328185 RepID=A0AAW2HBB3_9NEOP
MQLTAVLCRWAKRLPRGHIWRGKYRLYKKVEPKHLLKLKTDFELEEKNMFYLRHPYIPIEVSYGHGQALGKPQQFLNRMRGLKTWFGHRYLGDRYGFLKTSESWE